MNETPSMLSLYKDTVTTITVECKNCNPEACDHFANIHEPKDGTCDFIDSNGICWNRQVLFMGIEKLKLEYGITAFKHND